MGSITRNFANNILTDGKFDATDVVGNITSTGIDDNATSNAITIDSNERVQFTRPRSNTLGDSALEILPSDTVVGMGFRMENTNNDLVIEKSSPSGSEAEILRIRIGGGIALGGTGDANTLDDYEEGTWTPTTNIGYASATGTYVKVGNIVTIHMNATTNAGPGDTSQATSIGGLPFSVSPGDQISTSNIVYGLNQDLFLEIGGTDMVNKDNADNTAITRGEYGSKVHRLSATYITN